MRMRGSAPEWTSAGRPCLQANGTARSISSASSGPRRRWPGASSSTSSTTAARSRRTCGRWDRPCPRSTAPARTNPKGLYGSRVPRFYGSKVLRFQGSKPVLATCTAEPRTLNLRTLEPQNPRTGFLLFLPLRRVRFALRDEPIELLLIEVGHIHPGVRHLVHRAIAPADPLSRIRVVRIPRGVVVPRCEDDHRALRQERGGAVGVHIIDVPVPLEPVDGAQHFLAAVGVDRLDRHRLAAHVHV